MNKFLRKLTIALLILGAALYGFLGWRSLHPSKAAVVPGELAAAVISPRRVPDLVAISQQDAQLRAALTQLTDAAGAGSCLDIERNGIDIVATRSTTPLIPASAAKLLTASSAIDVLGPDKTFVTEVKSKSPKNGVIEGPVYLIGGGDPLLFTQQYQKTLKDQIDEHTSIEQLADAVVAAGVKTIRGGVNADDRMFDGQRSVPSWEPAYIAQAQVGSIGALTVNQGIDVKPNGVRTVTTDPATQAASVFTGLLKQRGVQVALGPGFGATPGSADDLAKIESKPLSAIIKQMLTESDNTTAEILLKQIARSKTKRGTTTDGTSAVMQSVAAKDTTLIDGSGLDRGNRTTCAVLARVLSRSSGDGVLTSGLARAGQSGTLTQRMTNTAAVGRVQAKTGTLSGVSALAGWARPDNAAPLTFSMIVNGKDAAESERLENRLAVTLAALPPVASSVAYAPG